MSTGIGGGLADGVQMAGQFLMPAMRMKQQQKQFDQSMEQRKAEMGQHDKLFHDRLAIEQGWNDGRAGRPSMFDAQQEEQAALPPDAFPRMPANPVARPAPGPALPPDAFPRMPQTPAQVLAPVPRDPIVREHPTIKGGSQIVPPVSAIQPTFSMQGLRPRRY